MLSSVLIIIFFGAILIKVIDIILMKFLNYKGLEDKYMLKQTLIIHVSIKNTKLS